LTLFYFHSPADQFLTPDANAAAANEPPGQKLPPCGAFVPRFCGFSIPFPGTRPASFYIYASRVIVMMIGIRPGFTVPTIKDVLPAQHTGLPRAVSAADVGETERAPEPIETTAVEEKPSIRWWSKGSFSFKDILDMLNPLQHLPVISTLYRKLTGETIGGVARIIGGAIYGRAGGIASMISSVANAIFGAITGKDMGERIYAAIFGEKKADPAAALADGSAKNPVLAALGKTSFTYQPELAIAPGGARRSDRPDFVQVASALDSYERIAPACSVAQSAADAEEPEHSSFVRKSRFED
jgi:hypothetical protein